MTSTVYISDDAAFLEQHLLPIEKWKPFPTARDNDAWNAMLSSPLNQQRKAWLLVCAETFLNQPWPVLPATLYLEFARNGNRARYEKPYFERRRRLSQLVLAECMERHGRFMDEITNGIWAITEEASWALPAHASFDLSGQPGLPSQQRPTVALFSCETAMILSETLYLLRDSLQNVSPRIEERIRQQVFERVIEPTEQRDDDLIKWFSGTGNWSPWCASNILGAAFYLMEDHHRLAKLTAKLDGVVNRFIGRYPADGGCDEGAGYWDRAAGTMLNYLELLYERSEGAVNIYHEPLIHRMGEFIVHSHLDGPWCANFADASPHIAPTRATTYRYGQRIDSQEMRNLVLLSMRNWRGDGEVWPPLCFDMRGGLFDALRELFWLPAELPPVVMRKKNQQVWLNDLQFMVARESDTPGRGLVLAAKGHHNAANHNHNDVGQFILMNDGFPFIVDLGVEAYTNQTFSEERYDIWCIRGSGHNAPVVNGVEQCAGREYEATNVEYAQTLDGVVFGMNLEKAYPAEADMVSLRREIELNRNKSTFVRVTDTFETQEDECNVVISLFSPAWIEVESVSSHEAVLHRGDSSLILQVQHQEMSTTLESISLEHSSLENVWGPSMTHIKITGCLAGIHKNYTLKFFHMNEKK